jgi:hypothetical protein
MGNTLDWGFGRRGDEFCGWKWAEVVDRREKMISDSSSDEILDGNVSRDSELHLRI